MIYRPSFLYLNNSMITFLAWKKSPSFHPLRTSLLRCPEKAYLTNKWASANRYRISFIQIPRKIKPTYFQTLIRCT